MKSIMSRNLRSLLIGAGSIFDLSGWLYFRPSEPVGDFDALQSDWKAIEGDLEFSDFKSENLTGAGLAVEKSL